MEPKMMPYLLKLDANAFAGFDQLKHVQRFLSDMQGYYYDKKSMETILIRENPLIYEYWEMPNSDSTVISVGITRISAGLVGDEYYMTRGHFHTLEEDGEEIYIVLQGQGYLLLHTRAGDKRALELSTGYLYFAPKGWAHRSINCGEDDLTFLTLWPNTVGHDYQSIARTGFPELVIKGTHGPSMIQNQRYQSYQAALKY